MYDPEYNLTHNLIPSVEASSSNLVRTSGLLVLGYLLQYTSVCSMQLQKQIINIIVPFIGSSHGHTRVLALYFLANFYESIAPPSSFDGLIRFLREDRANK